MYLPKGTEFIVPKTGNKKYTALVPISGKIKRVSFGDRRYEHYEDRVPVHMGGGEWKHLNHLDKDRRRDYRNRHKNVLKGDGTPAYKTKYTPAFFSWYFLW